MKADFSRVTFRPDRHFSSVRMQQGVVQLDADANEQADIELHRDETTTADVVGPSGSPLGDDAGFELAVVGNKINIGKGRMYVHGTLCENDGTVVFDEQPDLPGATLPTDPGRYLFYLDVWQRHITPLEHPDIHEVALGEAETTTRTRTVWQVRWQAVEPGAVCTDFGGTWTPPGQSTGALRARESPAQDLTDNCLVPPGAGFRRLENQLYRVEIHAGSNTPGGPTFKWSRDNGSVAGALESIEGVELKVAEPTREAERGLSGARWVELTDDVRVLNCEPGTLVEVVPEGDVLNVTSWSGPPMTMADFGGHPLARRWDSDGAVKVTKGKFIELEDGVEVEFRAGDYRSGDYWLIPARSLTGAVLWPRTGADPQFETAAGIEHRYCALALLDLAGGTWTLDSDCRNLFPSLTELTSFFYLGGDAQEAMPDLAHPNADVPLGLPLRVGVSKGKWPVKGMTVRFKLTTGTGKVGGSAGHKDELTNNDGVASCVWAVDAKTAQQSVTAMLLNDQGASVHLPIRFGATLSTAARVSYDPQTCAGLANAFTVQDAIDRVSRMARLYYSAGDGQQGLPGAQLDDLRVVVASDCGRLPKVEVKFAVVAGDATVGGGSAVTVITDGDGEAGCDFRLGKAHFNEVVATIESGADVVGSPSMVRFRAQTSIASQVGYDPKQCAIAAGANTVQEAIDALCKASGGGKAEPAIRIEEILFANGSLFNDSQITTQQLAAGIQARCDGKVDLASIENKPTCFVALDLPWPVDRAEREQWGDAPVATQRIVLAAQRTVEEGTIVWTPTKRAADWLIRRLNPLFPDLQTESVLAWFTLKGNFIWQPGAKRYLDGNVLGVPGEGRTDLMLPSGDGRRGGDFEMWFHVVPT